MANTMQSINLDSYFHLGQGYHGIVQHGDDKSAYRGVHAVNNVDEMMSLDYGFNYFDNSTGGDVAWLFMFSFMNFYDGDGSYLPWAVSNDVTNFFPGNWQGGLSEALYLKGSGKNTLTLGNSFDGATDSWNELQSEVRYWCSIYRTMDAPPFNDLLFCDIYDSAARSNRVARLRLSDVDRTAFHRYHISGSGWNDGPSAWGRWGVIEQKFGKNTDWPY